MSGCEAYAGPELGKTIHELMTRLLGRCTCVCPNKQVDLFGLAEPVEPVDERKSA